MISNEELEFTIRQQLFEASMYPIDLIKFSERWFKITLEQEHYDTVWSLYYAITKSRPRVNLRRDYRTAMFALLYSNDNNITSNQGLSIPKSVCLHHFNRFSNF